MAKAKPSKAVTVAATLSLALLSSIVSATQSDQGFAFVDLSEGTQSRADVEAYHGKGFVEVDENRKNEAGEIAVRATDAGIGEVQGSNTGTGLTDSTPATAPAAAPKAKASYNIASVALPAAVSARVGSSAYPFDDLEVGQSFFVPATAERPDPGKSIASTITSANERHSEVIEGETRTNRKGNVVQATRPVRKFESRRIADGAPWGHSGVKGVAVLRTL